MTAYTPKEDGGVRPPTQQELEGMCSRDLELVMQQAQAELDKRCHVRSIAHETNYK